MASIFHLRSSISCLLIAVAFLLLAVCGLNSAFAQGSALSKTSLGHSQNTTEDLENSLIPGKPKFGKGEKKEEVDAKKLPSKSLKDPAFQGTLDDLGLDWGGGKLGKPRSSNESDSKVQKKAVATEDSKAAAKNPDPSREKDSKSSKSEAADDQNKEQKQSPAKSGDKPSEKEKVAANKTDGDR